MSNPIKWSTIIAEFDPKTAVETPPSFERLAQEVGIEMYDYDWERFEDHVKKYFVKDANWVCTDTRVGLAVYTLDGDIVAVSAKGARKNHEYVYFVSMEAAFRLKRFMETFTPFIPEVLDMEVDTVDADWFNKQ